MNENRVVISVEEQETINSWMIKNYKYLEQNTNASGCFCRVKEIQTINENTTENEEIYQIVNNIRNRVIEKEKLQKYKTCEALADLIYFMEPGTKLHDHDDSGYKTTNEGIQIRFNVCIKKPEEGGRAIYAGKLLDLVEREYIICRAEIDRHSSEWIKGDSPKINLSLGFIVDYEDIHLFSNREKVVETVTQYNDVTVFNIIKNQQYETITEEVISKMNIEYNKKYLLNCENKNNANMEAFIYNVALIASKNKFINLNPIIHKIEFSFFDNKHECATVEYNKENKKNPIVTCITHLNDHDGCFIISNVDTESYKYKEIPEENVFFISKIRKTQSIVFDGSKYYGFINLVESNSNYPIYLKINIWENMQSNIDVYADTSMKNDNNTATLELKYTSLNKDLFGNQVIYNNNLIEKLFYNDNVDNEKKTIINMLKGASADIIKVENKITEKLGFDELHKRYGDLASDLFPFINESILISSNRFYNSKILVNALSKDVCFWIINECEKLDKWIDSPYANYGKYINIEKLPAVSSFVLFSANFYLMQLSKSYNLDERLNLNICDVFITKYNSAVSLINEKKTDSCHFSLNIQLNDIKDFEGGEIVITNNDHTNCEENRIVLNQGDMFIYNNNKLRNNGGVTNGEKYVLVFLINIIA